MKKSILVFTMFFTLLTMAQKKNIMYSQDIKELENFLQKAHPEDPRRKILKSRIVSIKNATWMRNGNTTVSSAKPLISEPPKIELKPIVNDETEEFKKIIAETPEEHKQKTVKMLNQFFNEDISSQDAILLIENRSNCNMIMRIKGETAYNIPIKANGENSLILKKGNYQLVSNVCNANFSSKKQIEKNMIITVNPPVTITLPVDDKSLQTTNNSSTPQ
jgi:hypothetical protein